MPQEQDRARDAGALSALDLLVSGMSYMAPGFSLYFTTAVVAGYAGIHTVDHAAGAAADAFDMSPTLTP